MTFTAKLPNGKLINLANESLQSQYLNSRIFTDVYGYEYTCLCCGAALFPVKRAITRLFFRHKSGAECAEKLSYSIRTSSHQEALIALSSYLTQQLQKSNDPETKEYIVVTEFPFKKIGRRADIAILDKNYKPIEVHEIQLSNLSSNEIEKRTIDYENSGVLCFWHFGLSAEEDTKLTQWFMYKYGYLSCPFEFENKIVIGLPTGISFNE